MGGGARPGGDPAARKAEIVAASARLRRDLGRQLEPLTQLDAAAVRLRARAASLLHEPVVVGATILFDMSATKADTILWLETYPRF